MTKHQFEAFTKLFTTVVKMCDSEEQLQDFLVHSFDATSIDPQTASKTAYIEFTDGRHKTTEEVPLKFGLTKLYFTTLENFSARFLPAHE